MLEYPRLTNSRPGFKDIPDKLNENLARLGAPHLDSFNDMLKYGLSNACARMTPVCFLTPAGEQIELSVKSIRISKPKVPLQVIDVKERRIYPAEARLLHTSYTGNCTVTLDWKVNGLEKEPININAGEVPIMLKSNACNLDNLTPAQMVAHGEHDSEWGGIFIVKGNEKIIRMLLMSRRNYPISIKRSTWKARAQHFTDLGILIRCVRDDEVSLNNVLHYLENGTAKLMFSQQKMMSYLPVCLVLKCLMNYTDLDIYKRLTHGYENDQYYLSCITQMLQDIHAEGLHTHEACKQYLGSMFRPRFPEVPSWKSNACVTDYILNERILLHLNTHKEKFDMLVLMIIKLYQCAQDRSKIESVDSVMMQEVLTSGALYQKFLCDRVDLMVQYGKANILKILESPDQLMTHTVLTNAFKRSGSVANSVGSFLATGNAMSRSGLGLMQSSGLVVMAENINRMRYMSHFRSVHRGSFFTTMRTTEARQLLPDAWGFICPVHTPDGAPCGLLNHLTVNAVISTMPDQKQVDAIAPTLAKLGLMPIDTTIDTPDRLYVVVLDGKMLGHIRYIDAEIIIERLRFLKIKGILPQMMEIGFVPYKKCGQFPGLFIFTGPARMMRPVRNIELNEIEYIGTMEQVYMEIALSAEEAYPHITTHVELSKIDFMSNLANLIPMPDYNQSPRNMYQCQMGKQTMGTPCLNWSKQAANKLYRLQTPATPLFRPVHHDNIRLDDFAMGTNAVVAVISYTGYDMEDAMIINKSAFERGFAYGSIYKSKFIELTGTSYFARSPHMPELLEYLDNDGLPQPGMKLEYGVPFYCYYDTDESKFKVMKVDEKEDCIVDSVRYCGDYSINKPRMVCITLRIPRAANIGDKFASRAGQKGICSQKYPAEDLPFTESGLIPDIVFNPHGFPSRMTIAMMIETMAGKCASVNGMVHDATPFRYSEDNTAINYFGKLLEAGGYNYYGTERLYSGVDGRELHADIFFGVVHYQRLRHMVFDKWQVRSTGPVDLLTQQPIKGRKRGGGVRFGEMERDALIAHGAAYLLHDRLFHNSDRVLALGCRKCGCLLAPMGSIVQRNNETGKRTIKNATCQLCGDSTGLGSIEIPHSFRYLVSELSAMNINARLKFKFI